MRSRAFCILLLGVVCSFTIAVAQTPDQAAGGQSGAIHGVVVTADNKKPIPGAVVELASSHRSETTDEKGEFNFSGVPFGTEVVVAKKANFLCTTRLGTRPNCVMSVDVFTPVAQVELTMLPEAIVEGRVVDQESKPIRNLALRLLVKEVNEDGFSAWSGLGATRVRTDTNGEFRMTKIEAGRYLLLAPTTFDPPDDFPPAHPTHGYSATYYPGVKDQKEAQLLEIHAGDKVSANLTVRRDRVQAVTVNFLWSPQAEPGPIGFNEFDSTGTVLLAGGYVDHTHSARFLAPPGEYKIGGIMNTPTDPQTGNPGHWPDGTSTAYYGSAKFTVRDEEVTVDNVPLQQPINVSLHVRTEEIKGEAQRQNASQQSEQIEPVEPVGAFFQIVGDGYQFNNQFVWQMNKPVSSFEFKEVPPGQYTFRASASRSAYVASLTCGSRDLLREPLVIGPGIPACFVEAVIRNDLASFSIGLTTEAVDAMAGYGTQVADVALIPVDGALDRLFSGFLFRKSEPLRVRIPPGSYIAFLFDGRSPAWREPEFQEKVKRLGTPVTVAPGDNKTLLLDFKPELASPKIQPKSVGFGRPLL